jgi:hypothetical protein
VTSERTYQITRRQLIDALASIELRPLTSGPMAHKIVAEDMADAILRALEATKRCGLACPECQGFGLNEDRSTCEACDGDGYLSLAQMEAWRAARGHDADALAGRGGNFMDRFLDYLDRTTPEERLAAGRAAGPKTD